MDYQEKFEKENEYLIERMNLAWERIGRIPEETLGNEAYQAYFRDVAQFLGGVNRLFEERLSGEWERYTLAQLRTIYAGFYRDVLPGETGYDDSYVNPDVAVRKLGETFGGLLCFLYEELRGTIAYAMEGRFEDLTIFLELFLQVYTCFTQEAEPDYEEIQQIIYWFYHDYSEIFSLESVAASVDATLT